MQESSHSLRRWQITIVSLLVIGYAGYYLCRSNFSVCLPLIAADLSKTMGITPEQAKVHLGGIASLSVLIYAIGKFLSGGLADFMGGRRNFLLGMGGSVVFTVLFALSGTLPLFTLAALGNRLVQSMGWVGMIKITSRWFAFSSYGSVMGLISLSFLFGDFLSRRFMGALLEAGADWRMVYYVGAGTLLALLVLNTLFLKETPLQVGLLEPPTHPDSLFGTAGESARPEGWGSLLKPLFKSPLFWVACALSFGFTLLSETFNTWTPTYFVEALSLDEADAANKSALFPLFGGLSVLAAGFLSDRLGKQGRALILFIGCALTVPAMLTLGTQVFDESSASLAVWLIAGTAFMMMGPYSYLSGVIALDFGAKRGSATACGCIDGIGYLGGVLAGKQVAELTTIYGWNGAFLALSGVAVLTTLAGLLFWYLQRKTLNDTSVHSQI